MLQRLLEKILCKMRGGWPFTRAKGLGVWEMLIHFRELEGPVYLKLKQLGRWPGFLGSSGDRPHPELQFEGRVPHVEFREMGLFSVAVQGLVQNCCSGKDGHEPVRALPPPWGQSHGLETLSRGPGSPDWGQADDVTAWPSSPSGDRGRGVGEEEVTTHIGQEGSSVFSEFLRLPFWRHSGARRGKNRRAVMNGDLHPLHLLELSPMVTGSSRKARKWSLTGYLQRGRDSFEST